MLKDQIRKYLNIKIWIINLFILTFALVLDSVYYPFSSAFVFILFVLLFLTLVFFEKLRHLLFFHIILFSIYGAFGIVNLKWTNKQFEKQFACFENIKDLNIIKSFPADGDSGNGGFIIGRAFLVKTNMSKIEILNTLEKEQCVRRLKKRAQYSIIPVPKRFSGSEFNIEIIESDSVIHPDSRKLFYYKGVISQFAEAFANSNYLLEYAYWEEDPF